MDELQKLYDELYSRGKTRKSFEQFKAELGDETYRTKVFDVVTRDGLFNQDRTAFDQIYVADELKKKAPPTSLQLLPGQTPTTALPAEGGSSASQGGNKFNPNDFMQRQPMAVADATFLAKPIDKVAASKSIAETAKRKAETARLLNIQKVQDAQKKKEDEARVKSAAVGITKTPEFQNKLNIVNDKLIDQDEDTVVDKMNTEFGRNGFTFEKTGIGDAMIVRSFDGKHTLKVDLDPFTNATEVAESAKLRQFLSAYAQEDFKINNEDFLSQAYKAQNLRTVGRLNPDGTESTVKMTSFEEDGKYYAIPTLFPKDPNNYNTSASTWQELPFDKALKVARERGELFQFKTDQEAKDFAKGAWKDVSTRDIEADKFYKERGLDYITEKNRYDKYKELDDIIDFVEGNNEEGKEGLKKTNPELFIKGRLREDADEYIKEIKKQRDALEPIVKDYSGWGFSGKSEVARMDWDAKLAEREKEIAAQAIKINNEAKAIAYQLDAKAIETFGVSAKDLLKYKNTDPNTQAEFDAITKEYYSVQQLQKEAATKFEIAKTYFDAKADKQINGELKENLRGFWNSTYDAYNQGLIGEQLLSFAMPGGKDVSSFADRKEAAEYIAKQYADMYNTESRTMARWRNARGLEDWADVFFDDPLELATTMAASSMSQMLPYGLKIIAGSATAGLATGAAVGSVGLAPGAVAGGVTGLGYGLRAGFAATNLASEYVNAVMASVEKNGFNPMDPESLAAALGNENVWKDGRETGLARGIPIAAVDLLTAGLAGRVFKPTSALASRGSRIARGTAERFVVDPAGEALGELAAQGSEVMLGTGREKIGWKEIAEESMGGIGSNTFNWGMNSYKDLRDKNNIDIANSLTNIANISSESASDEKITSWVNNMLQLKKIDADVAQRINVNVGLRREARELLEVGTNKNKNSEAVNRTMELLAAKTELSSSQNRREIYRTKIQDINAELAIIGETKKTLPVDKAVDLSTIIGATRQGTSQYSIDGRRFTKEQFIEKVNALPDEQLNRVVLGVKNDTETGALVKARYNAIQNKEGVAEAAPVSQQRADRIAELESIISDDDATFAEEGTRPLLPEARTKIQNELQTLKTEQDAIQKQAAGQVPVQSETGVSGEVAQGVAQAEPQVFTQEGEVQEVVAPLAPAPVVKSQGVSVTNKSALSALEGKSKGANKVIISAARKAITTLQSIFPEMDIFIHEDTNSYNEAMGGVDGVKNSAGNFASERDANDNPTGRGRIDINLSMANARTVAHEVAHAIMLKKFGENPALFKNFRDKLSKILSESSNKALMDFANQYVDKQGNLLDVTYEEYLAELTGALAAEQGKISATTLQKIAALINEIVSKLTNGAIKPFEDIKDTNQVVDFFNNISSAIREGNEISPAAIEEGVSLPIGNPTTISRSQTNEKMSFPEEPLPLSFVKESDKIDINKLIDDIIANDQTVWFWMADQLGRGNYYDAVIQGEHYLDAGPSFALDPKNRNKGVLWASGLARKTLQSQIDKADYIFFISGSPEKAKLFNRRVLDLVAERINKTSSFNDFKQSINEFGKETIELNTIKDALNSVNSFDELAKSPKRKPFLIAIGDISKKKTSPEGSLKELLNSFNAFVDYNELRDGFYKENGFSQNDIMLVGKPTGLGGKADHSTYESEILGEVVGVPDAKIDSWSIMPESIKEVYKAGYKFIDSKTGKEKERIEISTAQKAKIIAAETGVIRKIESATNVKSKSQEVGQGLSEADLPGYDSMMTKVEAIVAEKKRGRKESEMYNAVIRYVQGSLAYINATDVQREALVRQLRKQFGIREKSAPNVGRLLGVIQDIKKITMSEKDALKKQLKDYQRGAKDVKKALAKASADLSKAIKEMEASGKLTANQVANVLRKFSKVDLFNEDSVDNFVEYMTNVFADAEYSEKMSKIRGKLPTARKNVRTKLGAATNLIPAMEKLFAINPNFIPSSVLDSYILLVDMMGARQDTLDLMEINVATRMTNAILDAVDNEQSKAEELSDRFDWYSDPVLNDDGSINFAETIKAMVKDGTVTEEEAELMRKYKNTIMPRPETVQKTEQEIEDERAELADILENMSVDPSQMASVDDRRKAGILKSLLRSEAIQRLSVKQLNNLIKVVNAINNGYFPHSAQLALERLNAINNAIELVEAVRQAKPLPITKVYARIKGLLTRNNNTAIDEMVVRGPLYFIDQLFGDFKTKRIFNAVFSEAAKGQAAFEAQTKIINQKIEKARNSISKSPNETLMSSYRMMTYMIQNEFLSNPNSDQVNPAHKYLAATIKYLDSNNQDAQANMLQSILDNYTDPADGSIDINMLYRSFNKKERAALKVMREINDGMTERAVHTAGVIRGQRISPLANYVHMPVMMEFDTQNTTSVTAAADAYNRALMPSTKGKSLIERDGKVHPLNFNVFSSVEQGAKSVLMDYHLTEAVRTARKTLVEAEKMMAEGGRVSKEKRQIFGAIKKAFNTATENLLLNNYMATSWGDEVINFISKQGYRAILASSSRFVAELLSNVSAAVISFPKSFATGLTHAGFIKSPGAIDVVNNVRSKQINRLFSGDMLSGRFIDSSILSQKSGIKASSPKNKVLNAAEALYNVTLKPVKNAVELSADALISTPDKMVMRPIWFGAFANKFESITGRKVDFEKIAANDESYMEQYKDAIEAATNSADEKSVLSGATNNAYMGILKGKSPSQSGLLKAFNNFNSFMTQFAIYEYTAARTGIYASVGNGSMSRREGAALLAGVTTRMVVYSMLTKMLGDALVSAFAEEPEEEDDKTLLQKFGQALTSAVTGMLFGRDFGNATRTVVNLGLENINENYLTGLRNGEYDPYKDAIAFSSLPREKKGVQSSIGDYLIPFTGSMGPMLKTADLTIRKLTEDPKIEPGAVQRQTDEIEKRIPLEIAGNLGFIPLYKDIRKVVIKNIYASLKQEMAEAAQKKEEKEEEEYQKNSQKIQVLEQMKIDNGDAKMREEIQKQIDILYMDAEDKKAYDADNKEEKDLKEAEYEALLQGYDTQTEMKSADKPLWEKTFGPNSSYYKEHYEEKKVKKMLEKSMEGDGSTDEDEEEVVAPKGRILYKREGRAEVEGRKFNRTNPRGRKSWD